MRARRARALLVVALAVVFVGCLGAGLVGMGLLFEDRCDERAGDRGASGPFYNPMPPSVECRYSEDGRMTTERDSGALLLPAAVWLVGTGGALSVTTWLWRSLELTPRHGGET